MTGHPSSPTPLYEKMADTATAAWRLKLELQEHAIEKARDLWESQKEENKKLHESSVKAHKRQKQLQRFQATHRFLQMATGAASLSMAILSGNPWAIALGVISLSSSIVSSWVPSKPSQALQLSSAVFTVFISLKNPLDQAKLAEKFFQVLVRTSQGVTSVGIASSSIYSRKAQAEMVEHGHNSSELTRHIDHVLRESSRTTASYSIERQLLDMTAKLSRAASAFAKSNLSHN